MQTRPIENLFIARRIITAVRFSPIPPRIHAFGFASNAPPRQDRK